MQLAANWPDKLPECQVIASDQWGNPYGTILTKQDNSVQVQRLSEARFQFGWVNKSSDSPIPRVIADFLKKSLCFWRKTSERFPKEIHR